VQSYTEDQVYRATDMCLLALKQKRRHDVNLVIRNWGIRNGVAELDLDAFSVEVAALLELDVALDSLSARVRERSSRRQLDALGELASVEDAIGSDVTYNRPRPASFVYPAVFARQAMFERHPRRIAPRDSSKPKSKPPRRGPARRSKPRPD
jgi:hypothetical protein